jgi:Spy/CpxP family protein refolding chaperone
MSRSRGFAAAVLASALLVTVTAAAAEEGPDRPWMHHRRGPPPIDRVLEENAARLQLSDATRAQIQQIAEASRSEAETHHGQLRALHDQMRDILHQDSPDEAAVMRKADEIGAAETALQKQRLHTMLEIRALLTPAQRAELVKIFEEHRSQRR